MKDLNKTIADFKAQIELLFQEVGKNTLTGLEKFRADVISEMSFLKLINCAFTKRFLKNKTKNFMKFELKD